MKRLLMLSTLLVFSLSIGCSETGTEPESRQVNQLETLKKKEPPPTILKLKLKELLINLLYHSDNDILSSYLKSVTINSEPSLTHIMENNFSFNLKLEEFAKMSHRSLSKFKRDFFNHYNTSPGKWLLSKRLDYAANLILHNSSNITQIAFESGFEDISHFSRKFKEKFGVSPRFYPK